MFKIRAEKGRGSWTVTRLRPASSLLASRAARPVSGCLSKHVPKEPGKARGFVQPWECLQLEVSSLLQGAYERGWPQVPEAQERRQGSCHRAGVPNKQVLNWPQERLLNLTDSGNWNNLLLPNSLAKSTTTTTNQRCLMSNALSLNQNIYTTDEITYLCPPEVNS